MANRQVTRSGKDRDGDITSLCGSWGSVTKTQAIQDIETNANGYYVGEVSPSVWVKVRTRSNGTKYLTTEADGRSRNNLDNLPDC